jgi:hypothetical protein
MALIRRIKLVASTVVVVVTVLFTSWLGGRKTGKTAAKLKEANSKVEAWNDRSEVENRVARERDARERLRKDWSE